jgi:hypothetical protein
MYGSLRALSKINIGATFKPVLKLLEQLLEWLRGHVSYRSIVQEHPSEQNAVTENML